MTTLGRRIRWPQGNYGPGAIGWGANLAPNASGESIQNWSMLNSGGAVSAAVPNDQTLDLTLKREDDVGKKFHYWRPTKANVLKNSVYSTGIAFQWDGASGGSAGNWGFFNAAGDDFQTNTIRVTISGLGAMFLAINDSVSTLDSDNTANGTIAVDTDYWLRMWANGTIHYLDIYSTFALFLAAASGDVDRLSVAVAAIGGTVTCDRFGFHNTNGASMLTDIFNVYWVRDNLFTTVAF